MYARDVFHVNMSAWYALTFPHITNGPGKRYVGPLPPHIDHTHAHLIPYVSSVGSASAPWVAGVEGGPTYPDPSPHAVDQPYIDVLKTSTWPVITMNEWNEAKKSVGMPSAYEFYVRRSLRSTDLGGERFPVMYVDKTVSDKYVAATQFLLDTHFKPWVRGTASLMEPHETYYKKMTRAYVEPSKGVFKLHPLYVTNADDRSILMTVVHEIAHMLREVTDRNFQVDNGHDWFWQQICLRIGGDGHVYNKAFVTSEHTLRGSYVFTCTQSNSRGATCIFHIPKFKTFTYDDRYTRLVGEESGTCAKHTQPFQRTFWDDSSRPAVVVRGTDGIVTLVMDTVEFNGVKTAALTYIREVKRLTTPESTKRVNMDPLADLETLTLLEHAVNASVDMTSVYAAARRTGLTCLPLIQKYTGVNPLTHAASVAYKNSMFSISDS